MLSLLELAQLSQWAYQPLGQSRDERPNGWSRIAALHDANWPQLKLTVFRHQAGAHVLAFSDPLENGLSDYENYRLLIRELRQRHSELLDCLLRLYYRVQIDFPPGPQGYWLTGYSLGGALAQCLGFERGLSFITFNAPGMLSTCSMWKSFSLSTVGSAPTQVTLADFIRHCQRVRSCHWLNVHTQQDLLTLTEGSHVGPAVSIAVSDSILNDSARPSLEHSQQAVALQVRHSLAPLLSTLSHMSAAKIELTQ